MIACNREGKEAHGHIASKGLNLDVNPGPPNSNFCELSTVPRIHFSALVY